MFIKRLILSLFFIIPCLVDNSIACMAADDKSSEEMPNVFEKMLPEEIVLYMFEQNLDGENFFEYLVNALKEIKTIKSVDRFFNRLKKKLIQVVMRKVSERFAIDLSISDSEVDSPGKKKNILDEKLIEIFKMAQANKQLPENEKLNEDDLAIDAAKLILAGANFKNISLEYCNRLGGHPIKISILQFMARTNLFIKLIPLLIFYGMDIDAQDIIGNTALHTAGSIGYKDMVEKICNCNADVSIQNRYEDTVLHSVSKHLIEDPDNTAYVEIMHILLKHADFTVKNKNGETVLDLLADYGGDDRILRMLGCVGDLSSINEEDRPYAMVSDLVKTFLNNLNKLTLVKDN